jgi:hypothetical protein
MSDEEWIHASEAYARVQVHILRAGEAICERAHDGLIAARAERLLLGKKVVEPANIPQEFWWARGRAALKAKWPSGDFETWIDHEIHCRAYGVEFARKDIERMLPPTRSVDFARSAPGNYAPAAQCRAEVMQSLKCSGSIAEQLILRHATAGLLIGRCSEIRWSEKDRYGTNDYQETNVEIPEWVWEECLEGEGVLLDWVAGAFVGRGVVNENDVKVRLTDVEFEVAGVVRLERAERARQEGEAGVPESTLGGSGNVAGAERGRRLSELWRPWVAELVAYIHANGLPAGVGSQGQEELIKAIEEAFAQRGEETLSRSTAQPVVQAVLDRLRAAEI